MLFNSKENTKYINSPACAGKSKGGGNLGGALTIVDPPDNLVKPCWILPPSLPRILCNKLDFQKSKSKTECANVLTFCALK